MVSLKHKFQSSKADSSDATAETWVRPSNWNDEHDFKTTTDNIYLGRAPGAGPGPVQEIAITNQLPPGMIMAWPAAAAPAGWYLCNGNTYAIAGDTLLFGVLGNQYGGTPGSTFMVPNLVGRVIAMGDVAGTVLPGTLIAATLGASGGIASTVLLADQLPEHDHNIVLTDPKHTHKYSATDQHPYGGGAGANFAGTGSSMAPLGDKTVEAETGITVTFDKVGKGDPINNLQPTLILNYVIKR